MFFLAKPTRQNDNFSTTHVSPQTFVPASACEHFNSMYISMLVSAQRYTQVLSRLGNLNISGAWQINNTKMYVFFKALNIICLCLLLWKVRREKEDQVSAALVRVEGSFCCSGSFYRAPLSLFYEYIVQLLQFCTTWLKNNIITIIILIYW